MLGKLAYCAFSFGGGVQSSAIYLMLMHEPWRLLEVMGELPDKVYFADTGAETQDTYKALEYMRFMCPYQSDANWLDLKVNSPFEFERACIEDERIRDTMLWRDASKHQTVTSTCYLHRSCVPLREVEFKGEGDLFTDECQGVCNT